VPRLYFNNGLNVIFEPLKIGGNLVHITHVVYADDGRPLCGGAFGEMAMVPLQGGDMKKKQERLLRILRRDVRRFAVQQAKRHGLVSKACQVQVNVEVVKTVETADLSNEDWREILAQEWTLYEEATLRRIRRRRNQYTHIPYVRHKHRWIMPIDRIERLLPKRLERFRVRTGWSTASGYEKICSRTGAQILKRVAP
jgi:hypothetical protein